MEQTRLRILLSAYACEPNRGSEPGVGWEWATRLAKRHDVWVLTRANNREVIEKELGAACGNRLPHFIYVDLPAYAVWLKKRGVLPVPVYYVLWQLAAARRAKTSALDVDLVHHVTFNGFRFPGMWWRCPWKVVLGPLGGASTPSRYYRRCFGKRWWREWLRAQMIKWWWLNPWTILSFRRADALVFVTDEMAREFGRWRERTRVLLETAASDAVLNQTSNPVHRAGFLWVGNIAGHKGWRLALESFAKAFGSQRNGPYLRILGGGEDEVAAKQLARDLGIAGQVQFCGYRARTEVWEEMRRAKGLLFSSVRDTSGNVVLEAMSLECPVMCLNHQGSSVMTDATCALRVEPGPWDDTVEGFAATLRRLEIEPELVLTLGRAGRTRVLRHFRWDHKLDAMNEIYASVMGGSHRQSGQRVSHKSRNR